MNLFALAPAITWVKVEKPSFDLIGIVLGSFEFAGLLLVAALVLGVVLGAALVLSRRQPSPASLEGLSLRLDRRA